MRLTPRGGRDAVEAVDADGVLLARVRAAPVEGAANEGLLRLLSDVLGVSRRELVIEAGEGTRRKRLRLGPRAAEQMAARFPAARVQPLGVGSDGRGAGARSGRADRRQAGREAGR